MAQSFFEKKTWIFWTTLCKLPLLIIPVYQATTLLFSTKIDSFTPLSHIISIISHAHKTHEQFRLKILTFICWLISSLKLFFTKIHIVLRFNLVLHLEKNQANFLAEAHLFILYYLCNKTLPRNAMQFMLALKEKSNIYLG